MKIIILNGAPRAGKGEFSRYIGAYQESMIADVKEIARRDHGWNGEKTTEARQLLSDIKTAIDADGKEILKAVVWRVLRARMLGWRYCTIDARDPGDIADLVTVFRLLGCDVVTVIIRRDVAEADAAGGCSADVGVLDYNYDYEIWNNSTLECFHRAIDESGVKG